MARILIDCTHVDFSRQPTGIPRVVLKYIEEAYGWAEQYGHEVIPVVPASNGLWLCRPVPGVGAPLALRTLAIQSEAFERQFAIMPPSTQATSQISPPPHLIVPGPGDVLFSPAYWHDNDPQLYIDIKETGCRIVILVHDILPVTHKHFYNTPWRYTFAAAVLQAIGYADALYCVSGATRDAVRALAETRSRITPPMTVMHNGFEPLATRTTIERIEAGRLTPHTTDKLGLKAMASEQPLVMVGSIEPKKGHIPVIKCLEALWSVGYIRSLVIVGRVGWMEREIVEYIRNSPFHGTRLFWLTDIDDFDLAYVYIRCRALVFASLAEGFGIPMIEAAEFGKPIVVLDTPIAREVLGDAGLYFDEAASLMRLLIALEDESTYQAARARLATFDWPTWSDCAPPVLDALASLASLPRTADGMRLPQ